MTISASSVFDLMQAITASHTTLAEGNVRPLADNDSPAIMRQFPMAVSDLLIALSDAPTPPTATISAVTFTDPVTGVKTQTDQTATFSFSTSKTSKASTTSPSSNAADSTLPETFITTSILETLLALRLLSIVLAHQDPAFAAALLDSYHAQTAALLSLLNRPTLPPPISPHPF